MTAVGVDDLELLAIGAAVLGTGGGGDPYVGKLWAQQRIRAFGAVELMDAAEIPDDSLVIAPSMMGAPSVIVEKIPSGGQLAAAFQAVERAVGRSADAIICIEAGGINSTIPFALAAELQLPVIDGDGMGRAFPEVQMVSFAAHGIPISPMAIADETGNVTVLHVVSAEWAERLGRALVVAEGGSAVVAKFPMTGADVKRTAIRGTLSLAREIGELLHAAGRRSGEAIDKLAAHLHGRVLFRGKLGELERRIDGGFVRGHVTIDGLDEYARQCCRIVFQNENLAAYADGVVLASVPDLIIVLEEDSALPITTERLRFGLRVVVLGVPCAPVWRQANGIERVAPRCFGLDFDYVPLEQRLAAQ